MLPVQVKSVSSSPCSLSEASALLHRFLASDACSDSFATEYVANVAQALQDSKSGICGGPESPGEHSAHLSPRLPRFGNKFVDVKTEHHTPPHSSKLHSHANELVPSCRGNAQCLPSAEDADASLEVESVLPGAEHAFERRKKKRGHFAVENGFETDVPRTSDIEYSALMHHDKKRRKREEHKTETESVIKELYGFDDQSHHDRKRRKEKQQMDTKIVETDHLALDNQRFDGKKRRKKEKQGKDTEDMETLSVPENMGSPVSLSLAKRKVEVSSMNANNVKVSVTPMSGTMEEFEGSLKRKREEGKMFPSATHSVEKEREETDREVSLVEFENLDSDAKKKTKKKKRRKEIGE